MSSLIPFMNISDSVYEYIAKPRERSEIPYIQWKWKKAFEWIFYLSLLIKVKYTLPETVSSNIVYFSLELSQGVQIER